MRNKLTNEQQLAMRLWRASRRLSATDVARQIGASPASVIRWEDGVSAPRGLYRRALAQLIPELGL
jgi:DNA-binding transcriptional regulator YiaG